MRRVEESGQTVEGCLCLFYHGLWVKILELHTEIRRVDESTCVANEEGAEICDSEEPEWLKEASKLIGLFICRILED